jgi:hypothetical protein
VQGNEIVAAGDCALVQPAFRGGDARRALVQRRRAGRSRGAACCEAQSVGPYAPVPTFWSDQFGVGCNTRGTRCRTTPCAWSRGNPRTIGSWQCTSAQGA